MSSTDRSLRYISRVFPLAVLVVCITPFLLSNLGVDFSSADFVRHRPGKDAVIDDYFYFLHGAFTHTLLEWSAVSIAICATLLALVNFRVTNDSATLVIGTVLLASGCMDAFHILAANRLIDAAVDNSELIPFTWAVARVFQALVLMLAVGLYMRTTKNADVKHHFGIAVMNCCFIVIVTYLIIHYCSTASFLPKTQYPDALITRPWDVAPLVLYISLGFFLFPAFYRSHASIFTLSLFVSLIPQIILELHMVFGSSALFDNHFNIAHSLKIIAYFVPFLGLVMDYSFSYQKQAGLVQSLMETKTHSQAVLDTAIDGIVTIDYKGIIQSVNPMVQKFFGYKPDELIGQNVKILLPESYRSEHDGYLSRYRNTGEKKIIGVDRELLAKRKDGSTFPIELAVVEVPGVESSRFTGFIRDISERKILEKSLKERDAVFSTLVNSSPMLMWMLDEENKPVVFNEQWLTFFGADLETELNKTWDGTFVHPDDREGCYQLYCEKLKMMEAFDHEFRMFNTQGRLFWFREIGSPIFNGDDFKGFIGNLVNITDRKVMEQDLKSSMGKLLKSNEELEQFAYVASHDLQEPLRMVASYTQLLSRRYKGKLDTEADEFIGYAVDGAKRMQQLIRDLLQYSRIDSEGKKRISLDCGEVLQEALTNLSVAIEEAGARLTHDDMPQVIADKLQLLQLFQNLISNAIKYRDPDKQCQIHIGVERDGEQWVFSVKDNGIGINPEFYDRIFVIFKRLHAADERSGTGIGLSVCKKIVERHGGRIWVESTPENGSTFFFTLKMNKDAVTD